LSQVRDREIKKLRSGSGDEKRLSDCCKNHAVSRWPDAFAISLHRYEAIRTFSNASISIALALIQTVPVLI